MCKIRNPREANKSVNRTQQKIRQSGIPKVLVEFLFEVVLVCFTGQGYMVIWSILVTLF